MLKCLVLFSALLLLSTQNSKTTEKKKDDTASEEMQIYLFIGQSNMAGRATIECADEDKSDASRHEMYMPKLLELIAALRSEFASLIYRLSLDSFHPINRLEKVLIR